MKHSHKELLCVILNVKVCFQCQNCNCLPLPLTQWGCGFSECLHVSTKMISLTCPVTCTCTCICTTCTCTTWGIGSALSVDWGCKDKIVEIIHYSTHIAYFSTVDAGTACKDASKQDYITLDSGEWWTASHIFISLKKALQTITSTLTITPAEWNWEVWCTVGCQTSVLCKFNTIQMFV